MMIKISFDCYCPCCGSYNLQQFDFDEECTDIDFIKCTECAENIAKIEREVE